jgi:hypothetical protein
MEYHRNKDSSSIRAHDRNCPIAIKTQKHINNAAVCYTNIVVYRIKLTVKGHLSVASRAAWPLFFIKMLWFTAESMPRSNFFGCPFEF